MREDTRKDFTKAIHQIAWAAEMLKHSVSRGTYSDEEEQTPRSFADAPGPDMMGLASECLRSATMIWSNFFAYERQQDEHRRQEQREASSTTVMPPGVSASVRSFPISAEMLRQAGLGGLFQQIARDEEESSAEPEEQAPRQKDIRTMTARELEEARNTLKREMIRRKIWEE